MVTLFIKLCILCSVILSTSDAFLRSKNSINSFRQTSIYSGNLVEQFDLTTLTKFMKRALVAPLIFTLGQLPILSMPGHAEENIPTRVLSSSTEETTNSKHVEVYFGVGCFWHVQHELVGAERKILSRGDDQLTVSL